MAVASFAEHVCRLLCVCLSLPLGSEHASSQEAWAFFRTSQTPGAHIPITLLPRSHPINQTSPPQPLPYLTPLSPPSTLRKPHYKPSALARLKLHHFPRPTSNPSTCLLRFPANTVVAVRFRGRVFPFLGYCRFCVGGAGWGYAAVQVCQNNPGFWDLDKARGGGVVLDGVCCYGWGVEFLVRSGSSVELLMFFWV